MKKFKFTLQTVHRVRELKSERENLTLAEMRAEAEKAAARVSQIEVMRLEAVENYLVRLRSGQVLNPLEMELSANHFASLNSLQKEAQRAVEEKNQACVRQLETVTAARREVSITDKLRSQQELEHRLEYDRREQNGVDELVSAKFARRVQQAK